MSKNFESDFEKAARKQKQKKIKRLWQRIGVLFLIVVMVVGVVYLGNSSEPIIIIGNLAISLRRLLLSIIGLSLFLSIVIYAINHPQLIRLCIKPKNMLMSALLITALIFHNEIYYFMTVDKINVNSLIDRITYNPTPPVSKSPWSWKENTIHPVVANMSSTVETSIESVAKYIYEQEPDPYLRIKALHDYVVSRVTYDLDVLTTGIRPSQDAETVFSTHKAVCEGYANLFVELVKAVGTDVVYIKGRIRQELAPIDLIPIGLRVVHPNYDWTLHAWNAVKIGDSWQLVDTTWDDSNSADSTPSYSAEYLMLPPKAMIISHFPDYSYWQLLDSREEQNTFEKQPILEPQFFADDLMLISPTEYETNVEKIAEIKIKSHPNYQNKVVAGFTKIKENKATFWNWSEGKDTKEKKPDIKSCNSSHNNEGEHQIFCKFLEPGDYQVRVFTIGEHIRYIAQFKFHVL